MEENKRPISVSLMVFLAILFALLAWFVIPWRAW
jgi:hypothetical protein